MADERQGMVMKFEEADIGLFDWPGGGGGHTEVFHAQAGEDRAAELQAVDP